MATCNHVVGETEGWRQVYLLANPETTTYSQHGRDSSQQPSAKSEGEKKKGRHRKEINIFSTQNWAENGNLHQVELTEP